MISSKPTIFCDIDGTLVKHAPLTDSAKKTHKLEILPGTIEKITEWEKNGYRIILTTGRKECTRAATEQQLQEAGIFYDQLIMGVGRGPRVVVNDIKPDGMLTAYSINLVRNLGLKDLDI